MASELGKSSKAFEFRSCGCETEISDEMYKKAVEGREEREREENCEDHRSVEKL